MPERSKHDHGPTRASGTRVLALDVGSKRIGMAVSDELRILARGLETLKRTSKRVDFEKIEAILREFGVGEIVVGHPVRLGGEASAQTDKITSFAAELEAHVKLPVHLWDERLTSVAAEEHLDERKRSVKKHITDRKTGAVDRIAAVMILQSFLDTKKAARRDEPHS